MDSITSDNPALEITRIIAGGDGIARRTDGCVVFVPRTAVGDRVEVEYTEEKRQWRRGRVTKVIAASDDRTDPACPHYARCGGCQLQHLTYGAQLAAKSSIIADSFRRLGGVTVENVEVEGSPLQFGYRNRVAFVARRRDDRVQAGYHAYDNPDEIVDVTECPLAEGPINLAWTALRAQLADLLVALPVQQDVKFTLRTAADGAVGIVVESDLPGSEPAQRLASIDGVSAVWWGDKRGRMVARAGAEHLIDQWGPYEIPLAGNSFLQVNREAAAVLDDYVVEQCGDATGSRIVDAYCGFGLRSMRLAQAGAIVTGIDSDASSISTAIRLASQAGIGVAFTASTVENAIARQLPADVVVLNPPRRGVDRPVIAALRRRPPQRVVYVSCDPPTLARDTQALGEQFELSACRAFDLFPQTAHVETVATLTRR